MKRDKLMLLLLAGAFGTLVIELRYYHAGVWGEHPTAYIPVITCGVAMLCCLGGLAAEKKLATMLGIVLLVCSCAGFAGVYFHTEGKLGEVATLFRGSQRQDQISRRMSGGDRERFEAAEHGRPLLAPLSITGLSLLAGILLLGQKRGT